jgi:hypothetical protein
MQIQGISSSNGRDIPKLISPFIVAACSPLTIVDQVWRDVGESGVSCKTTNEEKDR